MNLDYYNKISCGEWTRGKITFLTVLETENPMIKSLGKLMPEEATFVIHI